MKKGISKDISNSILQKELNQSKTKIEMNIKISDHEFSKLRNDTHVTM